MERTVEIIEKVEKMQFGNSRTSFNPPKDSVGRSSRPWKPSDLVLEVADKEFHVHRAVLMVSSPVFETMLSSNFNEKSARKIPLSGKNLAEIEQLLQGIYPDQDLWIYKENCLSFLKLSTEYQIDLLKTRCEEYLSYWSNRDMTVDEALKVIIFNQTYPVEEKVVQSCVDEFVSQTKQAWIKIQKHWLYPELERESTKRLTEGRMNYLEQRLEIGSRLIERNKGGSGRVFVMTFKSQMS